MVVLGRKERTMANMSYCRFQNTLPDLRDCEESEGMYEPETLSEEERRARKSLIAVCARIAAEFEDEDE